jgi:hypothetical protein
MLVRLTTRMSGRVEDNRLRKTAARAPRSSTASRALTMASLSTKRFIGGAEFGSFAATWPFASLVVSDGYLRLRCFRKYELTPREVVCEPCGMPVLPSGGVKFHHTRADYPWPLIFRCSGRNRVLEALQQAGFEIL